MEGESCTRFWSESFFFSFPFLGCVGIFFVLLLVCEQNKQRTISKLVSFVGALRHQQAVRGRFSWLVLGFGVILKRSPQRDKWTGGGGMVWHGRRLDVM